MLRKTTFSMCRENRFEVSVSVVFIAAISFFVIGFIQKENFIYYWDFANYWYKSIEFIESCTSNPAAVPGLVLNSIWYHEYNLVPVLFILPFEMLFGVSRLGYIFSITLVYAFPVILLFSFFLKGSMANMGFADVGRNAYLAALLCLGLSPQLWSPVLLGYPGVGGLIPLIGVLFIYSRKKFEELSYSSIIVIALLLCLAVVFRRWYAYWVAGFLAGVTLVETVGLIMEHRSRYRRYLPVVLKLITLGCSSFLLFLLLAGPMAKTMLTTDYSDLYSGYKFADSFLESLNYFRNHFGFLILIGAVIGGIFALAFGENRKFYAVLIVQFWSSMILFTRTQDFGHHHYLILLPAIYFFLCFFLAVSLSYCRSIETIAAALGVIAIVLTVNFVIVLVPSVASNLEQINRLLPGFRHYPLQRNDLFQIYDVLELLDDLEIREDRKIYVLASGQGFNDDILIKGCRGSKGRYGFCDFFATTAHVDKRDGLPLEIFEAGYVVTTAGARVHLAPEDQRVITVFQDQIVNGTGIGKNYRKLEEEFNLDNDIKVLIYKRVKDRFNENDLRKLESDFAEMYPELKQKFMFPPELFDRIVEQN